MGQGLGKNTPVKLSLGKANYEALLSRHGQWIRWRTATKCSCIQYGSMQPDIKCPICKGRGITYSYQKNQTVFTVSMLENKEGILSIEEEYRNCDLVEVYDYSGKRYRNAEKFGDYIHLNESNLPIKGTYFNIVLNQQNTKILESAIAEKSDFGYYIVPGITSKKANTDGVYYESPADILHIGKIKDKNGKVLQAKEFRLNQFMIDESEEYEDPLTVEKVEYLPPFIFVLLNQNLSQADAQMVVESRGDAVCTFPYGLDVSTDDTLTVLAGFYTQKEVQTRKDFKYDVLGAYFVYDIVSCTGIVDGQIIEYKEGKDFVIIGNNQLKWIEDEDNNYPEVGEAYSITFHVLPTYKVVKEIPQIRTSENQRFPKKAVIKLFTSYSDAIGVNRQEVGRKGIEGSY